MRITVKAQVADRREVEARRQAKLDKANVVCTEWPVMDVGVGGRRKVPLTGRTSSKIGAITAAEQALMAIKQCAKQEEMERRILRAMNVDYVDVDNKSSSTRKKGVRMSTDMTTRENEGRVSGSGKGVKMMKKKKKTVSQQLTEEQAWRELRKKKSKEKRRGVVTMMVEEEDNNNNNMKEYKANEKEEEKKRTMTMKNEREGDHHEQQEVNTEEQEVEEEEEEELHILMAEDNSINTKLMLRILEKLDYRHVRTVTNGVEAIDAIKREDFDIVLMDIMMPLMDGYTRIPFLYSLSLSLIGW